MQAHASASNPTSNSGGNSNYHALSGEGDTSAPAAGKKPDNGNGQPTWLGTTDAFTATGRGEGDDFIGEQEF